VKSSLDERFQRRACSKCIRNKVILTAFDLDMDVLASCDGMMWLFIVESSCCDHVIWLFVVESSTVQGSAE
jgi:hypothetical protein